MKLKGKVALVTGGSRGIGRGIANALASEGADLAIADIRYEDARNMVNQVQQMGRNAIAVQVDVTQTAQVQQMVSQTISELGGIDILVNNAGVITTALVEDLKEEDWDLVMNVNAKGTFLCCKAVLKHMKERNGGSIINVSSIAGKNGYPSEAHYCASKFAVIGFSNTLAKEVARDNITVNCICPGIVRTYMWDYLAEQWKNPGETIEESWDRHVDTIIPQGRPQTPEDMGALAVVLATAKNITGQAINVDGGVELH